MKDERWYTTEHFSFFLSFYMVRPWCVFFLRLDHFQCKAYVIISIDLVHFNKNLGHFYFYEYFFHFDLVMGNKRKSCVLYNSGCCQENLNHLPFKSTVNNFTNNSVNYICWDCTVWQHLKSSIFEMVFHKKLSNGETICFSVKQVVTRQQW